MMPHHCHRIILSTYAIFWTLYSTVSNAAILRTGNPLLWTQAKPYLNQVRLSGITQFINHYHRSTDVEMEAFLWGDEIEYGVFEYSPHMGGAYDLSLSSGTRLRENLTALEDHYGPSLGCIWQPEYGSWMVEMTPRTPYGSTVKDMMDIERSLQLRRKRLHSRLTANEIAPSISVFPMIGVSGYPHTINRDGQVNNVSNSQYISDRVINPHPRFGALTHNIRLRRSSNINISVPLDTNPSLQLRPLDSSISKSTEDIPTLVTPESMEETTEDDDDDDDNIDDGNAPNAVHMDAMAFGMGCCCLQVTIQTRDELESRYLTDQLSILAPLLHALSAATPIIKGRLLATDTRWDIISQSVDDRTPTEFDPTGGTVAASAPLCGDPMMAGNGSRLQTQSRYSQIPLYIARASSAGDADRLDHLNDLRVSVDDTAYSMLVGEEGRVDPILARYIAHLFTRDPLVIFDDSIRLDDNASLDHFENIQSTNWRSMRWKPPTLEVGLANERIRRQAEIEADDDDDDDDGRVDAAQRPPIHKVDLQSHGPGWRTEFRPLEVQLTDFENAAFALIVVLLARSIIAHAHSFYIPMSLVHENMRRAQLKDAVLTQKFWFRRNSLQVISPDSQVAYILDPDDAVADPCRDRTIDGMHHHRIASSTIPSIAEIDLVELSIDEIINGEKKKAIMGDSSDSSDSDGKGTTGPLFQGLIPHIRQSLGRSSSSSPSSSSSGSSDAKTPGHPLDKYLDLLSDRASGRLPTAARWMRDYVTSHPLYTNNRGGADGGGHGSDDGSTTTTTISRKVIDDLLVCCEGIGMGSIHCPSLYGNHTEIVPLDAVNEEELARRLTHESLHDDDDDDSHDDDSHDDDSHDGSSNSTRRDHIDSGKHQERRHAATPSAASTSSSLSPSSSPCMIGADANKTHSESSPLDV